MRDENGGEKLSECDVFFYCVVVMRRLDEKRLTSDDYVCCLWREVEDVLRTERR